MKAKKITPMKKRRPKARKPRRSPIETIQALKVKRDGLAQTYQERLERLDDKIARIEARHASKLALNELLSSKTPEELAQEFEEIKAQQKLLKKALKLANG